MKTLKPKSEIFREWSPNSSLGNSVYWTVSGSQQPGLNFQQSNTNEHKLSTAPSCPASQSTPRFATGSDFSHFLPEHELSAPSAPHSRWVAVGRAEAQKAEPWACGLPQGNRAGSECPESLRSRHCNMEGLSPLSSFTDGKASLEGQVETQHYTGAEPGLEFRPTSCSLVFPCTG